jgi:hypothetical protein
MSYSTSLGQIAADAVGGRAGATVAETLHSQLGEMEAEVVRLRAQLSQKQCSEVEGAGKVTKQVGPSIALGCLDILLSLVLGLPSVAVGGFG